MRGPGPFGVGVQVGPPSGGDARRRERPRGLRGEPHAPVGGSSPPAGGLACAWQRCPGGGREALGARGEGQLRGEGLGSTALSLRRQPHHHAGPLDTALRGHGVVGAGVSTRCPRQGRPSLPLDAVGVPLPASLPGVDACDHPRHRFAHPHAPPVGKDRGAEHRVYNREQETVLQINERGGRPNGRPTFVSYSFQMIH
jgi:hypothetical protein